jgi:biopolymer transport protein ExbB/TolQ
MTSSLGVTVSLILAIVLAMVATANYRKKARWFAERHAELDRLEAELEKIPPIPGSQRFRSDPALKADFKRRVLELVNRPPTDRAARLALEQLLTDELLVLAQREEVLKELAEPTKADRDELAMIPAQRNALEELFKRGSRT